MMPRAVIGPAGDIRGIGRTPSGVSGSVAFTTDISRIAGVAADVVVIDGDGCHLDGDLVTSITARCPLVYTTTSPRDPPLTLLADVGVVIGFDRGQVAGAATGTSGFVVPSWAGPAAASGTFEAVGPAASPFDDAVAELWRALAAAQHAPG